MIDGRSVLGLIPARGGSKSLPGKHLLELGGRPLIAWTAEAALGSELIDRAVLSTDDDDIAAAGERHGLEVPFRRPAALAADASPTIDAVHHALRELDGEWDVLVLLQPTSPLRTTEDIDAAIRLREERGAPACVSVTEAEHHPAWTYRIEGADRLEPLLGAGDRATRRQDLPPAYALNGALYVQGVETIRPDEDFVPPGTIGHVMPPERSVDIDSELDLEVARALLARTS